MLFFPSDDEIRRAKVQVVLWALFKWDPLKHTEFVKNSAGDN